MRKYEEKYEGIMKQYEGNMRKWGGSQFPGLGAETARVSRVSIGHKSHEK